MSWVVIIYFQERGTRKEVYETCTFPSREAAVAALEQLENDLADVGDDKRIVMDSGTDRVSFIKGDYRRTKMHELFDGPLVSDDPYSGGLSL